MLVLLALFLGAAFADATKYCAGRSSDCVEAGDDETACLATHKTCSMSSDVDLRCETGSGLACKKCESPRKRTKTNECTQCNTGYLLVDSACEEVIPCDYKYDTKMKGANEIFYRPSSEYKEDCAEVCFTKLACEFGVYGADGSCTLYNTLTETDDDSTGDISFDKCDPDVPPTLPPTPAPQVDKCVDVEGYQKYCSKAVSMSNARKYVQEDISIEACRDECNDRGEDCKGFVWALTPAGKMRCKISRTIGVDREDEVTEANSEFGEYETYYIKMEDCEDGIKNQDEEGVDCGGVCDVCEYTVRPDRAQAGREGSCEWNLLIKDKEGCKAAALEHFGIEVEVQDGATNGPVGCYTYGSCEYNENSFVTSNKCDFFFNDLTSQRQNKGTYVPLCLNADALPLPPYFKAPQQVGSQCPKDTFIYDAEECNKAALFLYGPYDFKAKDDKAIPAKGNYLKRRPSGCHIEPKKDVNMLYVGEDANMDIRKEEQVGLCKMFGALPRAYAQIDIEMTGVSDCDAAATDMKGVCNDALGQKFRFWKASVVNCDTEGTSTFQCVYEPLLTRTVTVSKVARNAAAADLVATIQENMAFYDNTKSATVTATSFVEEYVKKACSGGEGCDEKGMDVCLDDSKCSERTIDVSCDKGKKRRECRDCLDYWMRTEKNECLTCNTHKQPYELMRNLCWGDYKEMKEAVACADDLFITDETECQMAVRWLLQQGDHGSTTKDFWRFTTDLQAKGKMRPHGCWYNWPDCPLMRGEKGTCLSRINMSGKGRPRKYTKAVCHKFDAANRGV